MGLWWADGAAESKGREEVAVCEGCHALPAAVTWSKRAYVPAGAPGRGGGWGAA